MHKLGLALLLAILGLAPVQAQTVLTLPPPAGVSLMGIQVVQTCGAANITVPAIAYVVMDHTGVLCTSSSGGGGGGAITAASGAFASGSISSGAFASGSVGSGAVVDLGAQADAAAAADNSTASLIALLKRNNQNLTTINTTAAASIPAGANLIGKVGIDQTTPGTTNGVQVAAALPAGTNTIGNVNLAANVTATACSATVVTGNTAVNAFTAQTTLHGFTIANIDTSEVMWISFTTTAAASGTDSYPLAPATATTFAGLSSFTSPPGFGLNHALSVVAATNGHKFSCTWW